MAAAFTTLVLTNGTVSANLVDSSNFQLLDGSWSPRVADEKVARTGGSPFEDVDENPLRINIMGSSGLVLLENLNKLRFLLNEANRWRRGEAVAPVVIQVLAQGSGLAAAQEAVVLGRPFDGRPMIELPDNFMDYLHTLLIEDVVLNFRRRGEWLATSESESSSASTNPAVLTASTFSRSAQLACPMDVTLDGLVSGFQKDIVVLMANAADKLGLLLAPSGSVTVPGSGTFNSGTDAGYLVHDTNVRKLVPNTVGEYGLFHNVTIDDGIRTAAAYLVLRNLSNNVSYVYWAEWRGLGDAVVTTRKRVIPANVSTDPIIVAVGPATIGDEIVSVEFFFVPSTTGTGADALHVNYATFIGLDDSSHVVALFDDFGSSSGTSAIELRILHKRLEGLRAEVNEGTVGNVDNRPLALGNATVFMTGDTFACLPFGVSEGSSHGYYVLTDNVPGAVDVAIDDVTRQDAWLTPR